MQTAHIGYGCIAIRAIVVLFASCKLVISQTTMEMKMTMLKNFKAEDIFTAVLVAGIISSMMLGLNILGFA